MGSNGGSRDSTDSWEDEGGAISARAETLSEALLAARVIEAIGSLERVGVRRTNLRGVDPDDLGADARELLARLDGIASLATIVSQLLVRGLPLERILDAVLELRRKGALELVERRVASTVVRRERRRANEAH